MDARTKDKQQSLNHSPLKGLGFCLLGARESVFRTFTQFKLWPQSNTRLNALKPLKVNESKQI